MLQIQYTGKSYWGYTLYQDKRGRLYGNIDMTDDNNLDSIFLLSAEYEEPVCALSNIQGIDEVEITHQDGSKNLINVAQYKEAHKLPG